MKQSKLFHRKHTDKKIKITGRAYFLLIIFMFIVVIHDSFVHELPFYYILYALAGLLIGKFVALTQKVMIVKDTNTLTLRVKPIGVVITVLPLIMRFFAGRMILEEFNVVWATDGVYLLFIGIFFAKVKDMFKQIDEQVYDYLFKNKYIIH